MNRSISLVALGILFALTAWSCGGASLTAPTTPTPVPQTEIFSGTLNRNGAFTHPFIAQAGGTIAATLTTVDPDVAIGVSLGTWNGLACQIIIANDNAVKGITVTGTASAIGNFCVRVYDVGQVTSATAYEVSVLHP
jgi:hypothetical protein